MTHWLKTIALTLVLALYTLTGTASLSTQDIDREQVIDADEAAIRNFCPVQGLQPRTESFSGTGVILTAFDPSATWHFDVASGRRYALPDTAPCGRTCRLAADGTTLIYFNDLTNAHNTMRIDGAASTFLTERASDVAGWDAMTYFAWSPGVNPFIVDDAARGDRIAFPVMDTRQPLYAIQPGGAWAIGVSYDGDNFVRSLISLADARLAPVTLGLDVPSFNNYAWAPDGTTLAYVAPTLTAGQTYTPELKLIRLNGSGSARQVTDLRHAYESARIGGRAVDDLAWSPDSRQIAFWVTTTENANAIVSTLHSVDVISGDVTAYCGFTPGDRADNPPRLFWSPDGDYIGFAADVTDDGHGAYVIALQPDSGTFLTLTEGVYAAYGAHDLYAWGRRP
ncbi:MAG: hypothetical protein SGJ24_04270 [Chloroflexota bacterium]|nr:hypothetical protein [Chloroflexota bacterium]